jgi:hypothetical protein
VQAAAQVSDTATVRLSPQDTTLNINATNYSSDTLLTTYTWPDFQIANAILMKFDLSAVPVDAVVTNAQLYLALTASDTAAAPTYRVAVHKVLNKNPDVARATGYTADGTVVWSPNPCCYSAVPLAQADISPAYDERLVDKATGFKSWTVTNMVQEWLADPSSNRGVLLNSDATVGRDRSRSFASMENAAANLRPFLEITFTAADATPPSVAITAPANGATVGGRTTVTASANDNIGVVGLQFRLNGTALGAELTASPYALDWDTTAVVDGTYSLSGSARDAAGNVGTSPAITVTVRNGVLLLSPQDTWININATNYSTDTVLRTYTWPDNKVANAILMKFNLASIPAGTSITEATLHLAVVGSDATADAAYQVSAHKIVQKNPVIGAATGRTADGVIQWTANSCCYNNVPLAQADISAPYDVRAVPKGAGVTTWTITQLVREWIANPSSNLGLLLNSDTTKLANRYRHFASVEHPDSNLRPILRIVFGAGGGGDTTAPVISNTAASGVSSSGATIAWTTNEASDSQVEYGPTTAYGSSTSRDPALVTAHAVTLTGLSQATLYHVRVHSRDAAGNQATSPDFAFTTTDGTAPTVSITSPAGGATVSGTVSIAATASDNVGVAGVQFRVDGSNVGAEDTTAPYTVSWNTTTIGNGSHTLTAVARDAAGNQRTSANVTVNVSNSAPPPPGGGIATQYPGDAGIENHPDVIFVERFEEPTMTDLFSRWSDVRNGSSMTFAADVPAGSPGGRSLHIPYTSANEGGHLYRQLSPGVDDTVYVRYYIKYPTTNGYDHTGIWIGGNNPPVGWPNPQAGVKPAGNDRFIAGAEQNQYSRFDHYNYWMNMRQSSDGNYWGNLLLNNPNVTARQAQWMCVEHMVKLNNPTSSFNGEHAIWLDGVKVSHLGQGFPNGSWSGGIFTQSQSGTPFEGFRWRTDANLKINWIWLQVYAPDATSNANIRFDHVVVARSYIGCLTSGSSDTTPPTVSITAPASGATVSGTATFSASASDNVGVAGVQFKVDGVNVGAEDTSAPYSASWNTTTVPNGSHTLTAVARDSAGNYTTSAARTVTVSNSSPPPPGGSSVFTSNWNTATGTSTAAVTDGGKWPNYWEFNNGSGVQLLSVVTGGVNGHNALRVQQRGSSYAANVQVDNFMTQSTDYYLRFYTRNDDTSGSGDHIVTVDTWEYDNLTFMRKYGGSSSWRFVMSLYGCGFTYPIGHWGPAASLTNGQWYRFEYHVDFIDATHVRVHPRVYDAAGNLIMQDAEFRQEDFGSATWNGRSDWTLASYYAAGHSFCVSPSWVNDLGLGNNGQQGAGDTGRYWYFSAVEIRRDTWPGPVAPR